MKYIRDEDKERYDGIQAQIKQNSADWAANPERREGLHNANEYLYAASDKIDGGKSTYDRNTGTWSTSYDSDKPSVPTVNKSGVNSTAPMGSQYNSPYTKNMKGILRDIENSKFSYNAESDPLYKTYKDMYNREGDRALKSTLASVATAQGGVSSYASQAAQQASNYYAQQLTDKIPELYNLAYDKYRDEIQNKRNIYDMYNTADQNEYYRFADQRDFAYQVYNDEIGHRYSYDALNSDNYFRGRSADNADLNTAYQGAQLNQNIKADEWNMFRDKLAMGYTPSQEEMTQWGLSANDVATIKYQAMLEKFGGNETLLNMMLGGNAYSPVDPFGVSTGSGHGTTGYNGGSSGNAFTDYLKYEKEPTDGNTEGQASGQAASAGNNYVPVNYPQSGASGGVPYFQSYLTAYPGNFQMNGSFQNAGAMPMGGNSYYPSFYQYMANNGQFRTDTDNSGQTIQQQQQAATPQAAQTSAPQTDTASTANTVQDTANDTAAQNTTAEPSAEVKAETVNSARREALTDKGKEFYDQMIKNSGRLVNDKIDKSNYKDYLSAYDAYARDSQEKEETNTYAYPYGSAEIRQGGVATLDDWYNLSGYDPKNEGKTPILTSKAEYEATKPKKKSSGKKPGKKTGFDDSGNGTADNTPNNTLSPDGSYLKYADSYDTSVSNIVNNLYNGEISESQANKSLEIQERRRINELMSANTELYKKGTKKGVWTDSAAKKKYDKNSQEIKKISDSRKKYN